MMTPFGASAGRMTDTPVVTDNLAELVQRRPHGGWRVIYADPPWRYRNFSEKGEGKNATRHYDCIPTEALAQLPVRMLAARDCALVMWATFPMLMEALWLMDAWGFRYSSGGAWAKQSSTGKKWAFGPGYVFRGAAEVVLVGMTGRPAVNSRSERNLWVAPVREHSRKPDSVYGTIERLFDGPYVELFARQQWPGWSAWGNEIGRFEQTGEVVDV